MKNKLQPPKIEHPISYQDLFAQIDNADREIAEANTRAERWKGVRACAESLIILMRSPAKVPPASEPPTPADPRSTAKPSPAATGSGQDPAEKT